MPPAFLFLIPAMSNSWAEARNLSSGTLRPASEVAAYMGHRFPRQHPFLRFLQKITVARETCNFLSAEPVSFAALSDPIQVGVFRREAAYMSQSRLRQHPFLRPLQLLAQSQKTAEMKHNAVTREAGSFR